MSEWVCKHCGGDNQWQNYEIVYGSAYREIDVSVVDGELVAEAVGNIERNHDNEYSEGKYECDCGAEAHDIADLLTQAYDKCPTCKERTDEPNEHCRDHRPLYKHHPEQARLLP